MAKRESLILLWPNLHDPIYTLQEVGMSQFDPKFTITNRMTAAITQIERARGFLEAARLSADWVRDMKGNGGRPLKGVSREKTPLLQKNIPVFLIHFSCYWLRAWAVNYFVSRPLFPFMVRVVFDPHHFVTNTRLRSAILRWKNFWAFGQHRMAWFAASADLWKLFVSKSLM